MRLPLTIYSLGLLAFLLVWVLSVLSAPRPRRGYGAGAQGAGSLAQRMEALSKDALLTYVPLAAIALLMLSYGKPGLLPQWAGWAVVLLQAPRSLAVWLAWQRSRAFFGLLALICLIYLWLIQLPIFDPFPA